MAQIAEQPLQSLETLSRECVQLKARIEEDRAKARDIDCLLIFSFDIVNTMIIKQHDNC